MTIRQSLKNWYLGLTEYRWAVGVAEFDPVAVLSKGKKLKIHWIKGIPDTGWFADPFILSTTQDSVCILVENVSYATGKGVISKLTVDRHDWRLTDIENVLELPTHLSFPAYFRKDGKVWLYPESSNSGKLTLYSYDEAGGVCKEAGTLVERPLADAVIWNHNGVDKILTTISPEDNGRWLAEFRSEGGVEGPYKRTDTFSFESRVGRNAGMPFEIQGKVYRPAQDCSESYGKCVVIQEMTEKEGRLNFKEVRRFRSRRFNYWEGFHTFNVFNDELIAVDALGFRGGLFPLVISRLRKLAK